MKTLYVLALLVALSLPASLLAGRALFEASATVVKSSETTVWISGRTYDVIMRGDDGKLFLLHFHGHNPFENLEGKHVYAAYIQEYSGCQTGFVDEVLEVYAR